jgi:subtilisin
VTVAGEDRSPSGANQTLGTSQSASPTRTPYGIRQVTGGTDVPASAGEGVDVAVIDTGVDTDHPALADAIAACVDLRATGSCEDRNGHGTHLAGVVVADGGDQGPTGVAPGATLHAYKALAANGTGYADDVAAAVHRAAERDVDVVVLGLRSQAPGSLVERAIGAHREEVLVVAAAGNGGPSLDSIASPAAVEGAIAVGAIDGNRRVRASSARGATEAFCACRNRLELVAAGEDVVSTWPGGEARGLSGTSVAAPHVAGVAARVWASGAADRNGDGTVTPAEVRASLRSQAQDVTDGQAAGPGYDPASGVGLPVLP